MKLPIDRLLLFLIVTLALAAFVPAQGVAATYLDHIVTGAVASLFLIYGARLSPSSVKGGLLHWRLQSMVFASTFVLFPLIGAVAALLFARQLPADLATGILFMCLLPSTVQSSIAFTSIARGNVPAALCSASVSNLIGVVLTPVLVSLLLPSAGGSFTFSTLEKIASQILLPFAVGQLIRPWIGTWLLRHSHLTSAVDRGSVLVIVYAAFSAGMVEGIWSQVSSVSLGAVLAIDLAILAIVIVTTRAGSRWIGFSTEDEISIVFCGSKKGMAGGITMAAILFPGHALGLIVLPIMLFHQAQLFVCAILASRYAERPRAADIQRDAVQLAK